MKLTASHLLISPTLECPASCSYCYSSARNGIMHKNVLEAIIEWQKSIENPYLHITFHGGEPLAAGVDFYRMAFPLILQEFPHRQIRFIIQSNLWLLDEEFCELFSEYRCSLGTSLDGPQPVNDKQRGDGYYQRTVAGINLARRYSIPVGAICTITAQSSRYVDEIYRFFEEQHLDFSFHPAVAPFGQESGSKYSLDAAEYTRVFTRLLDLYCERETDIHSSTLDMMCRSVSAGGSELCTFSDCQGFHMTVDPHGEVYPCQRFMGNPAFSMGKVTTPGLDVTASNVWQKMDHRSHMIDIECKDCIHLPYCRGGCVYQSSCFREFPFQTARDPYCEVYKTIFNIITERAIDEVFSAENMEQVVKKVDLQNGLFRKGKLLSVMNDDTC